MVKFTTNHFIIYKIKQYKKIIGTSGISLFTVSEIRGIGRVVRGQGDHLACPQKLARECQWLSVADEDVGDPSRAGCACRGRASSPGRGTLEGCRGRICLRVTGLRLQLVAGWRMTGGAGGGLGREAAVPSGGTTSPSVCSVQKGEHCLSNNSQWVPNPVYLPSLIPGTQL